MLFNPHVSSLSFIKGGVTIELSIFLMTKALYEGLIFLSIFEKIFSFDFMNFISQESIGLKRNTSIQRLLEEYAYIYVR